MNHECRFVGTADFDEDAGRGEIIAKLTDSPAIRQNARLIAAAPDLLLRLSQIVAVCPECDGTGQADDPYNNVPCPWCESARAAIAHATGSQEVK